MSARAQEVAGHPRPHAGKGSGTAVWLLRHAEVTPEWQGRVYGGMDIPLSPEGERDSDRMAEVFAREPIVAVYGSPLSRARRLAAALARGRGIELIERPGLVEIDRGRWSGMMVDELHARLPDEVKAFHADPWSWRAHAGEADEDVLVRAWPVVDEALRAHAGRTVAIVCHYNVARVILACALDTPPSRSFELRVEKAHGSLLVDAPAGWRLVHSNVNAPVTVR